MRGNFRTLFLPEAFFPIRFSCWDIQIAGNGSFVGNEKVVLRRERFRNP
jgi:hypothetical protein